MDVGFGSMQIALFRQVPSSLTTGKIGRSGVLRIRGTLQDVNTTVEQYRDLIGEMVDNELENYKKMYLKDKEDQTSDRDRRKYPLSVPV